MKKGCIIAIVVILVLGFASCIGCGLWGWANQGPIMVLAVEMQITNHRMMHPDDKIEPTIEAWTKALEGNPQSKNLPRSADGLLADMNLVPLKVVEGPDGYVSVFSAGADKQMDTADDVGSGKLGEFMRSNATRGR